MQAETVTGNNPTPPPEAVIGRRKRLFRGDRHIWIIILLLMIISLIEVYSTTDTLAFRKMGGDTDFYFLKQLKHFLMGLFVIFIVQMFDTRLYMPWGGLLLIAGILLLAYTLVQGLELNSARRWTRILGVSMQPSDVVKVPMMVYLATQLAVNRKKVQDFAWSTVFLVIPIVVTTALIFPENLSTAVLFGLSSFILLALGNMPWKHLFLVGGIIVALFLGGALIMAKNNPQSRVSTWVNRLTSFQGKEDSFQAEQAKIAVASGMFWGKGPGNSTQRIILPLSYSDFIYANSIEEGGLALGLLLIVLYLWLLVRIMRVVRRSKDAYYVYLAAGLGSMMVLQAFVHMWISVGLLPVTGQPLPLVSMGGSSIIVNSLALGMILSIARVQKKQELYEGERV
ncbi:MAG: hypothetical protein CSA07_04560 [Bacteroidia bacterium]|nr:MAG: hypothetical protein CSA07_04560 [Bacteroidia bacterium]